MPSIEPHAEWAPASLAAFADEAGAPIPVGDACATYAAPGDAVESAMVAIWQDLLGVEPIGILDDFFQLGGDSELAAQLLATVNDVFGAALPVSSLGQIPTIKALATAVRKPAVSADPLIFKLNSGTIAPPFFCFPGANGQERRLLGHCLCLTALSRRIGVGYGFYGVTPAVVPENIEPPALMELVADQVVESIRAVRPNGPYLLGGYSLGGLVALEVARRLLASGEAVSLLALLDAYGPGFPRHRATSERVRIRFAEARELSFTDGARYVVEKVRGKLKTQNGEGTRERRGTRAMLWTMQLAMKAYLGRLGRYPGRINLFRASTEPSDGSYDYSDPTNGWDKVAADGVEVCHVPGSHRTILTEPHIRDLARAIRSSIRAACQLSDAC